MATEAGLTIKERLAMLQANNTKNPQLSGPMKTHSPGPHKTSIPVQTAADGNEKAKGPSPTANGKDTPQYAFKLRSTGAQPDGKGVTPLVPKKQSETGGVTPLVPKKPNTSSTGGVTPVVAPKPSDSHAVTSLVPPKPSSSSQEGVGTTAVAMRDKSTNQNVPRPLSIQERLAALREKAGDGSAETKPKDGDLKSPGSAQKKFPVFPKTNTSGPNTDSGTTKPSDLAQSIKAAADRVRTGKKASEVFLRHSDGKRFRKIQETSVVSSDPAPTKPTHIDNVDLTTFLQAYAAAKESKLKADAAKSDLPEAVDGAMDELYVEAESKAVQLRIRGRGSVKRATTVRVSEIPEFTEEEEDQEFYTDGRSEQVAAAKISEAPEEEYDDCASAAAQIQQQLELEDSDEIYEPLDEELESPPSDTPTPAAPPPTDDRKAKKDKEKDKEKDKGGKKKDKAKEEVNKKGEKERKKKEEEIKKQRNKFGLKDTDEKVGDGVVKNNSSAGMFTKELAVSKGEIIAILRMDNNPAGKWLVQNEQGKVGFVNSNNVEVATPAIRQVLEEQERQMMGGMTADTAGDEADPDDLYEALPEGEMDEIYEEL